MDKVVRYNSHVSLRYGEERLFAAIRIGLFPLTQWLLENTNVDVNHRRASDGWTALHLAAYYFRSKTVAYLLERGADPMIADTGGYVPLCWNGCSRNSARTYQEMAGATLINMRLHSAMHTIYGIPRMSIPESDMVHRLPHPTSEGLD